MHAAPGRSRRAGSLLQGKSATTILIMLTCAVYVLQFMTGSRARPLGLDFLILRAPPFAGGATFTLTIKVWLTWISSLGAHMFIHSSDAWHLIFNMLGLLVFGRELERRLGARSFLRLYLGSGLFAGLFWVCFNLSNRHGVVGASGAVFGLLAAAALLAPNVVVLLFFVIPVRLKWLLVVVVIGSILMLGDASNISHLAHLGGALGGYLIIRVFHRRLIVFHFADLLPSRLRRFVRPSRSRRPAPKSRPEPPGPAWAPDPRATPEAEEEAEDTFDQIDPILDKIGKHGMKSLTPEERRVLDRARERLKKSM